MLAPRCGTAQGDAEDRGQVMSLRTIVAFVFAALLVVVPAHAHAATPAASPTGGTTYKSSPPGGTAAQAQASQTAPVPTATVGTDGLAVAPAGAPPAVVALIAAGNQIAALPYQYGGGHGSFDDTAYDCSGSVSYALHGAALLDTTLDSTGLSRWGASGPGAWVTVYANKTHAYLVVAGLRFDTSGRKQAGTRWQAEPRAAKGFRVRHPLGL
jgi:cell wall-associated NlpC family hydrolase